MCAPTSNRLDRVAGGSRRTGCNEPPDRSHRLMHDRYRGLNERLHCAAGRSTHQQQPAIFNARIGCLESNVPLQQRNATSLPAIRITCFLPTVNGQVAHCNQCAESLRRPDLVCWRSERTQLVWAVAAVRSLVSLCTVSTDTSLVGASRVARLDCTDRCSRQQQPVAISGQPRSFRLPGFHNQIVVKSISIQ